uniref:Spr1 n=1 Tax=Arundo donax TaxID=35708 RepID=A0A0A9CS13_ARUDO
MFTSLNEPHPDYQFAPFPFSCLWSRIGGPLIRSGSPFPSLFGVFFFYFDWLQNHENPNQLVHPSIYRWLSFSD